jgi:hypothetical protein
MPSGLREQPFPVSIAHRQRQLAQIVTTLRTRGLIRAIETALLYRQFRDIWSKCNQERMSRSAFLWRISMVRFAVIGPAFGFALLLSAAPASAQNSRSFVSGQGFDSNNCALAAPCRTFQRAHDMTNAGGEIAVLDTAGYGSVVITKAISIVAPEGIEAGIAVSSGGTGVTINAGGTDAVSLRGLTIDGNGIGVYGIKFNSGLSLTVKNCTARHMFGNGIPSFNGTGIYFAPIASSKLFVSDTVTSDTGFAGIDVAPTGSGQGTVSVVINHVEANNNEYGFVFDGSNGFATVKGTVTDSVASSMSQAGFYASGSGSATTTLTVFHSVAANNFTGLAVANSSATLHVANSVVTGNTNSWASNGTLRSYGDNYIDGNGDGDPTPTAIARK